MTHGPRRRMGPPLSLRGLKGAHVSGLPRSGRRRPSSTRPIQAASRSTGVDVHPSSSVLFGSARAAECSANVGATAPARASAACGARSGLRAAVGGPPLDMLGGSASVAGGAGYVDASATAFSANDGLTRIPSLTKSSNSACGSVRPSLASHVCSDAWAHGGVFRGQATALTSIEVWCMLARCPSSGETLVAVAGGWSSVTRSSGGGKKVARLPASSPPSRGGAILGGGVVCCASVAVALRPCAVGATHLSRCALQHSFRTLVISTLWILISQPVTRASGPSPGHWALGSSLRAPAVTCRPGRTLLTFSR